MTCQVIATSVAEEGLDFPASCIVVTLRAYSDFLFNRLVICDLVVRFDPLQHLDMFNAVVGPGTKPLHSS